MMRTHRWGICPDDAQHQHQHQNLLLMLLLRASRFAKSSKRWEKTTQTRNGSLTRIA